jgi:hypothetical protein
MACLAPDEDGAEAVEELKGRDDVTLHQYASTERGRHPPSCADGHFVEPLLERELAHHAVAAREDVGHGGARGTRGRWRVGETAVARGWERERGWR